MKAFPDVSFYMTTDSGFYGHSFCASKFPAAMGLDMSIVVRIFLPVADQFHLGELDKNLSGETKGHSKVENET